MTTNSAAIRVGRLLEVRTEAGYRSASDVDALFDSIDAALARLPRSQQLVTVADWRRCPVMEGSASERLRQRMVALNGRTERSAALASAESPIAVLQFMRVIRESRLPDRKMFLSPLELITWMDEVLDAPEQQRMRQFLSV
jgi:hypothetical protein